MLPALCGQGVPPPGVERFVLPLWGWAFSSPFLIGAPAPWPHGGAAPQVMKSHRLPQATPFPIPHPTVCKPWGLLAGWSCGYPGDPGRVAAGLALRCDTASMLLGRGD